MNHAVRLCTDCVWVDANGYDPVEIDVGWMGFKTHWAGFGFVAETERHGDYNEIREPYFSNYPCDGCGDHLAGDRWEYIAYQIRKDTA